VVEDDDALSYFAKLAAEDWLSSSGKVWVIQSQW
jgi:hypothetical protein